MSSTLSAAWESIAAISRSDSGFTTILEGAAWPNLHPTALPPMLRSKSGWEEIYWIPLVRSLNMAQHIPWVAPLDRRSKRSDGPQRVGSLHGVPPL